MSVENHNDAVARCSPVQAAAHVMRCKQRRMCAAQAEDRSHRLGQERPVTVFRLITADTVTAPRRRPEPGTSCTAG